MLDTPCLRAADSTSCKRAALESSATICPWNNSHIISHLALPWPIQVLLELMTCRMQRDEGHENHNSRQRKLDRVIAEVMVPELWTDSPSRTTCGLRKASRVGNISPGHVLEGRALLAAAAWNCTCLTAAYVLSQQARLSNIRPCV